ncbi:MAG: MFS transporter [Saccharolobus sp.]
MLSKRQLAFISIGTSLAFFDIFNVPYIVSSHNNSLILSSEMLGYFIGGIFNGYLGIFKGRKFSILFSMILIAIGSLIGLISINLIQLFLAEFIIGFGIEGEISVTNTYVTEMSDQRGKAVGFTNLGGFLMSLIVGPIAIIAGDNWRLLFIPSLLIAIIALILRLNLPESRLWIRATKPKINNRVLIFLVIWIASYFAGYSLFASPIFSLLSSKGFQDTSLYFTYILYGDPLGVVIGTILNDKIERKLSSFLANFASGVFIILWPLFSGISIILLGFIIMFFQGFKFPTMYAYTAENFKSEIRSLGFGIADGIGHLGGFIGPIIFSSLNAINVELSFLVVGVMSIIASLLLITKGVMVNKKSLEQIENELL